MLNFFEQQARARTQSTRLVGLFALAVIAIVISVNLALWVAWRYGFRQSHMPPYFWFTNTAVTLAIVLGGSWVETVRLRSGGDEVARMVGARLLARDTSVAQERQLINIVDEMAIASGVACPKVYVMDRESAINAFAAGYGPNEAVITVSAGAMTHLDRSELQGVVAHEFSHILNGDMRLNLRLIGTVYGLLLIAMLGEQLMSSVRYGTGRDRDARSFGMVLFIAGVALWIVGYIGVLAGRMIKAAISREREYLADASAVQFTRNPEGIGGALRKIGGLEHSTPLGSQIDHPNAEMLSHLFLGPARLSMVSGLFATHPPLEERVERIYGRAMPMIELGADAPTMIATPTAPEVTQTLGVPSGFITRQAAALSLGGAIGLVGNPSTAPGFATRFNREHAVQTLFEASRSAFSAQAVLIGLVLDHDDALRRVQLAGVDHEMRKEVERVAPEALELNRVMRLPVAEMAIAALLNLTAQERGTLLGTLDHCVRADQRVSLSEWVLTTLVAHRLQNNAARERPVRYRDLADLRGDLALLLSVVAHACAADEPTKSARDRVAAGCAQIGVSLPTLPRAELAKRGISGSLERVNAVAPLRKPMVIKALVAAALDEQDHITLSGADLVRTICACIDAPLPPVVEAFYLEAADTLHAA
jgi:Zn-dependent protease with chaperone function